MPKANHNPIDRAINGLHEAAARPHRIEMLKIELRSVFNQIANPVHRAFLEDKFKEIEASRNSPLDLARIQKEIDSWNTREFPVRRGYR